MSDIYLLDETSSTNEYAKSYLKDGNIVIANSQTAGRGRYGNEWVSNKGNLYMSIIEKVPNLHVAANYSFITAIAVAKTIEALSDKQPQLKWPNDILIDGKKLSGILLETETNSESELFLIIGIGVNLISAPPYATYLDIDISNHKFAEILIDNFNKIKKISESKGFSGIVDIWLSYAYAIGSKITVRLADNIIKGIFKDIDRKNGCLILELEDKNIQYINSGEVFFE